MFERSLAWYTGAKHCVVVNSGSMAIYLALRYWDEDTNYTGNHMTVPEETYRSVPLAISRLSMFVRWDPKPWKGSYQIKPSNVWDCALRLKPNMYKKGQVQCLSLHPQKPLALSCGGGAILHDDDTADEWYRWMRFDGRKEGVPIQKDEMRPGEHCYMFPSQAAEGLHRLSIYAARYPKQAPDMPQPKYENVRKKWRQ